MALIFAGPFAIRRGAGLAAEEEHLYDAFVGLDAAVGSGGVGEFEGEMAAPACFGRVDICYDTAAGIGGLADTDGSNIRRQAELFQGDADAVAVRHQDEVAAVLIAFERHFFEIAWLEAFRVYDGAGDVAEDFVLAG